MLASSIALVLLAVSPIPEGHARNIFYRDLLSGKALFDGKAIVFPAPVLDDGQSADAQRAALRAVAGSDRAVEELLRDSVAAPFVLKVRDEPGSNGGLIRRADLWFAVHADLGAIDPSAVARLGAESRPVEAGNMRFEGRLLAAKELSARGIAPVEADGDLREWYARLSGRLLDRIQVEATDRIVATRSDESWVVAARTDPRFDRDAEFPNRWRPVGRAGGRDEPGLPLPYAGGASYVRIGRVSIAPGTLVVEIHLAFAEPRAWFDGAPILRSKFSVIAQDQIRRLRRDLARKAP